MGFLIERLKGWDAHHRLLVAVLAGIGAAILTSAQSSTAIVIVVAWDAFALVLLALAWVRIIAGKPTHFVKGAQLQDFGSTVMFAGVLVAACVSLFAVGYLLGTGKPADKQVLLGHVLLSALTVLASWGLVHTLFTLHYARMFQGRHDREKGGVRFPGEENPDYLDFAYFSFVIGMTCQVSDVDVTGRAIRRMTLVHSLVAFIFNAAILALAINIVSTMVTD
jgi:uncharacterized membrane protein